MMRIFLALVMIVANVEAWTSRLGMQMSFAPSTLKVQRAQKEKMLKTKIETAAQLKKEIPDLRAEVIPCKWILLNHSSHLLTHQPFLFRSPTWTMSWCCSRSASRGPR